MSGLDLVLGPMVTGAALTVFLNGILTTQCYNYFVSYPKDPLWIKCMVAYFFITDFIHTGIEVSVVYTYTVTFFGVFEKIQSANNVFAAIPVLSVSISSVAQGFFAWRVARLTRLRILGWLIGLFAVVQFLCGIGVTIAVIIVREFLEFQKFKALVIPWLTSSVVCDVIITTSLVWYLQTNKSGIARTDDIVTKLIRATVQTGMITALWAILDLVIFLTEDNSLHLLFNFPLAKMYTNSLMSTLNARRSQTGDTTIGGTTATVTAANGKMTPMSPTLSLPTWERGYTSKSDTRSCRKIDIIATTTTEIHHDIMGGPKNAGGRGATRLESDFDDYEMQDKQVKDIDLE